MVNAFKISNIKGLLQTFFFISPLKPITHYSESHVYTTCKTVPVAIITARAGTFGLTVTGHMGEQ
jgi:hypothetical protein